MKSPKIHRTPLYRAKAAYRNMKIRCLNANGKNPAYLKVELKMSMNEFLEWAIPKYEEFIKLNPGLSPSISRFNDEGHYEISNIEIISFKENNARQKRVAMIKPDGTKLCSRCKTVKDSCEFNKSKGRADGFSNECRKCSKIRARKHIAIRSELRRLKRLRKQS